MLITVFKTYNDKRIAITFLQAVNEILDYQF